MGLAPYLGKRDLTSTPEPEGTVHQAEGALRFVVQKHAASHLHYDFRLELDGVLKSWAVPKGPSLDSTTKRLAMQVEDHPYQYKDFEGVIPPGNYGAGQVIIWDQGTYHAVGAETPAESLPRLRAGLAKGDLKFILHGHKLQGEFALVKIKRPSAEDNAWLLIKKQDQFASADDVTQQERSVVSLLTIQDLQEMVSPPTLDQAGDDASSHDPMPHQIRPMLSETASRPFDDDEWLFEIKLDGYRAVAEIDNGTVALYSRKGLPLNSIFQPVATALAQLPGRVVLDGEVVILDDQGRASFQLLQNYRRNGSGTGTLVYQVFDLLYLNGRDLRSLPLLTRKQILAQVLPASPFLQYADHVMGEGAAFFELARLNRLEGIMAKRGSSRYCTGRRSREWLKIKTHLRQEAVVCGYTDPRGSRRHFGALVLGVYDPADQLRYIGLCGGGFDDTTLSHLYDLLQPLIHRSPPLANPPPQKGIHWVRPELVCEVEFSEWTADGVMRHPVFVGLRDDKDPREVHRESDASSGPVAGEGEGTHLSESDGTSLHQVEAGFTNMSKVFWPAEGYTKGDVIDYYRRVARFILPYLRDRPESLYRTPNGIQDAGFFQKDIGALLPDWIRKQEIYSESNQKTISYFICQDQASLLYMANLGCIEINPWLSRVQQLDYPDYLVIDLDPEEISFEKVIQAAQAVREVLQTAGAIGFPKTSGATGLHIYVPLQAKYNYETAGTFARLIATLAHGLMPEDTSLVRSPSRRQKKVYIDYLQNRRGQTLAAPYSIRPRPGAPVSTPLEWSEVAPGLNPADFTMTTIFARLEKKGDLFSGVLGRGINLEHCLKRLEDRLPGSAGV